MRTSLRRPFIADAVFADCGRSPYTVNAAAALTLGRSVQIPERPGQPQLRKNCSSFISSVAPPRGITTIGAIPGLRKAPLLRERQDGAALQPPGIAPAPYVLFRPEKQHGLSGEDDVIPPPAGGKRVVRNALAGLQGSGDNPHFHERPAVSARCLDERIPTTHGDDSHRVQMQLP